jgi:hypothetical protein
VKIKKLFKRKVLVILFAIYMFLWFLTAIWGNCDVRRDFDKQFEYGYPNLAGGEKVKITSIDSFYVYSLEHEYNQDKLPENGLFRYKSIGIAIAPFVIVDNMAEVSGVLSGLGATRLNLWLFGYTWWYPVIAYWTV